MKRRIDLDHKSVLQWERELWLLIKIILRFLMPVKIPIHAIFWIYARTIPYRPSRWFICK